MPPTAADLLILVSMAPNWCVGAKMDSCTQHFRIMQLVSGWPEAGSPGSHPSLPGDCTAVSG